MRVILCELRRRGWEFDRAWANAIQRIRITRQMEPETAAELVAWKHALAWSRWAFERNYNGKLSRAASDTAGRPSARPAGESSRRGEHRVAGP